MQVYLLDRRLLLTRDNLNLVIQIGRKDFSPTCQHMFNLRVCFVCKWTLDRDLAR